MPRLAHFMVHRSVPLRMGIELTRWLHLEIICSHKNMAHKANIAIDKYCKLFLAQAETLVQQWFDSLLF